MNSQVKIGGKIKHHYKFWRSITRDPVVLQLVHGAHLPFIDNSPPSQRSKPREFKMSQAETLFVDRELDKWINNGSTIKCPDSEIPDDAWFSPIFLVPKKEVGDYRLILNLSLLNKNIVYKKFKMINIMEILSLLSPGCYLSSFDFSLAFNHLPISKASQKFLFFQWKGEAYKFLVTPNGLSVVPYNIHRLCSPLIAYLHKMYINCCLYVDDSILILLEYEKMVSDIAKTVEGFQHTGFTINEKKSVLVPFKT